MTGSGRRSLRPRDAPGGLRRRRPREHQHRAAEQREHRQQLRRDGRRQRAEGVAPLHHVVPAVVELVDEQDDQRDGERQQVVDRARNIASAGRNSSAVSHGCSIRIISDSNTPRPPGTWLTSATSCAARNTPRNSVKSGRVSGSSTYSTAPARPSRAPTARTARRSAPVDGSVISSAGDRDRLLPAEGRGRVRGGDAEQQHPAVAGRARPARGRRRAPRG